MKQILFVLMLVSMALCAFSSERPITPSKPLKAEITKMDKAFENWIVVPYANIHDGHIQTRVYAGCVAGKAFCPNCAHYTNSGCGYGCSVCQDLYPICHPMNCWPPDCSRYKPQNAVLCR